MDIHINVLELASELANNKIIKFQNDALNNLTEELPFVNGITKKSNNGDISYTEEAQNKFNIFYEEYYDIIVKVATTH